MHRCLELAARAAGFVAPNPMVGAVLVHGDKIIGEGYHEVYGRAHAEVNCISDAISKGHADRIPESTLYVSLEPCAHFGKTPPCADLIIRHRIPVVVIGCRDPFPEVDGRGIKKLETAGVEVHLAAPELENQCRDLNKRFFTFHELSRPWILLKWAQTADRMMAGVGEERLLISNEYSNRLVHKWRSEEASILVGTNTALQDNPELTTRLWPGRTPIRLVIDIDLKLPHSLQLFKGDVATIVFNTIKHDLTDDLAATRTPGVWYYKVAKEQELLPQLLAGLYRLNIQSVIVEGGAQMLKTFIDASLWDEARVITNSSLTIQQGLPAPILENAEPISLQQLSEDRIETFENRKGSRLR